MSSQDALTIAEQLEYAQLRTEQLAAAGADQLTEGNKPADKVSLDPVPEKP